MLETPLLYTIDLLTANHALNYTHVTFFARVRTTASLL